MIDFPAIGGSITFLHVWAAVALFAIGYVIHEVMHVIPLYVLGTPYDVRVPPLEDDNPIIRTALFDGLIHIDMQGTPPRPHVVASALAPMVFAMAPLVGITIALTYPVLDIGTMLVLGAWFAVAIPSPQDWWLVFTYQPDSAVTAEVTA